ncbi:hypothetical protein HOY80DRAFT_1035764 [Tuber brumale]|nr:hypothetical protein HOY80DRAFT_1035764 [Tuber brumale]
MGNLNRTTTTTSHVRTRSNSRILADPATQHTSLHDTKIEASSRSGCNVEAKPYTTTDKDTKTSNTMACNRVPQPPQSEGVPVPKPEDMGEATTSSELHDRGPTNGVVVSDKAPMAGRARRIGMQFTGPAKAPILNPRAGERVENIIPTRILRSGSAAEANSQITAARMMDHDRNLRILESMGRHALKHPCYPSTTEAERLRRATQAANQQPPKGLTNRIAMKPAIHLKSPVLKPKAGAGVTKKTAVARLRSQIALKAKVGARIEVADNHQEKGKKNAGRRSPRISSTAPRAPARTQRKTVSESCQTSREHMKIAARPAASVMGRNSIATGGARVTPNNKTRGFPDQAAKNTSMTTRSLARRAGASAGGVSRPCEDILREDIGDLRDEIGILRHDLEGWKALIQTAARQMAEVNIQLNRKANSNRKASPIPKRGAGQRCKTGRLRVRD